MFTDKQASKQTNTGENITSLAKEISVKIKATKLK